MKRTEKTTRCDEAHLSDPVAVSLRGCWDNDLLSPVLTQKELQVLLDGRQSGQFSRKVNWRHAWMVAVPVHLFLQCLVDLIERAQEQLRKTRRRKQKCNYHGLSYAQREMIARAKSIALGTLYCCSVTWPLWKLSMSSVLSARTWTSFVTALICSDRSLEQQMDVSAHVQPGPDHSSRIRKQLLFMSLIRCVIETWQKRTDVGNADNRTVHPGNSLQDHPRGERLNCDLRINQSSSVLPVGHCLCCCLFVCFHRVPEMKGSMSESCFPGNIKHHFADTSANFQQLTRFNVWKWCLC